MVVGAPLKSIFLGQILSYGGRDVRSRNTHVFGKGVNKGFATMCSSIFFCPKGVLDRVRKYVSKLMVLGMVPSGG